MANQTTRSSSSGDSHRLRVPKMLRRKMTLFMIAIRQLTLWRIMPAKSMGKLELRIILGTRLIVRLYTLNLSLLIWPLSWTTAKTSTTALHSIEWPRRAIISKSCKTARKRLRRLFKVTWKSTSLRFRRELKKEKLPEWKNRIRGKSTRTWRPRRPSWTSATLPTSWKTQSTTKTMMNLIMYKSMMIQWMTYLSPTLWSLRRPWARRPKQDGQFMKGSRRRGSWAATPTPSSPAISLAPGWAGSHWLPAQLSQCWRRELHLISRVNSRPYRRCRWARTSSWRRTLPPTMWSAMMVRWVEKARKLMQGPATASCNPNPVAATSIFSEFKTAKILITPMKWTRLRIRKESSPRTTTQSS